MSVVYQQVVRDQHLAINVDGHCERTSKQKDLLWDLPWCICSVSIVQVILFTLDQQNVYQLLLYSHRLHSQPWRYLSYMLLHTNVIHLVLNVTLQCLIATLLECEQGSLRTAVVYVTGGLAGSLGTSILDPELSMVGASAGVYALLMSHVPHTVLNWDSLKYKSYRIFSVCSLCIGDVTYNTLHPPLLSEPIISWSAHLSGALAGFLAGFIIFTSHDKEICTLIIFIRCLVIMFIIFVIYLFIIRYIYYC